MSKTRILSNNLLIESTLTLNPEIFGTLEQAFLLVQKRLQVFASDTKFSHNMVLAFGEGIVTEPLQRAWLAGDVSNFPQIEIVSGTEINGAKGAYAVATNRIYLSEEFLSLKEVKPEAIASILLEEYGHRVDAALNSSDAPGDEGAIFSALVQGQVLSEEQIQQLKTRDDTATVTINGQVIEIEQARIQESGGQQTTPFVYSLPLESELTLVKFSWQNYSIPDEFQILYEDKRIVGNVGLQSGGESGEHIILKKNSDELTIKVTAPNEGTAWDFNVETLPLEITIDGFLGDVIEVDLLKEFVKRGISIQDAGLDPNGFGLESNSNSRGEVAENVDNFQDDLKTGKFYFVPTLAGTLLQFDQARDDAGLGESTLTMTNGNIKIPIKFNITDGFSTGAPLQGPLVTDNTVTFGTNKLDVYRQEQRLAYLGFPQNSGAALTVNGQDDGNELSWAKKLFNITVRPEIASARKRIAQQDDKSFKKFINSANAPEWNLLRGAISNLDFPPESNQSQRFYGTDNTGEFLQLGTSTLNRNLKSTGVSQKNGIGNPSSTHDGGRSIDIDDIPGSYFFKSIGVNGVSYVAALGGGFVVRDGNTYRIGNPNIPSDLANGIRTKDLVNPKLDQKAKVTAIHNANLFVFSQTEEEVQELLDAFSESPRIFYNDPRFFDTGVIRYANPHFDHIHFEIPIPQSSPSINQSLPFNGFSVSSNSLNIASPFFTNIIETNAFPNIIDIGNLENSQYLSGSINTTNTEQYYNFVIGSLQGEEGYFTTPRDFNLLLDGLSGDVDVELFQDFSEDGIRQNGEVIASSTKSGNESETINLPNLDEGIYYLRVFQKSGDTNYNLTLTVPPLPVPPDNAGNTPNNAQDLGILSGSLTRTDFIGKVDPDDYYRFKITTVSDFSLEVSGLDQGDLVATLGQDINNNGVIDFDEIIAVSDAESNEPEAININGLVAGTYYVWLSRNSGNTDYNLNLSATTAIIPPDQAGSTPSTALNIGSLNSASNFSDFVGNVDPEDFYRFSLANVSGLRIELNGLAADADLELAQDSNNDGTIDSNEIISTSELEGSDAEVIDISALAAGTYYVRVDQYEGDTNYNLSLTPTNAVGSDLSLTRTDSTGAVDLGEQYTYTLTVTNNGPSTANNVTLTENLPSGVNVVSATTIVPPRPLNYLDFLKFQLNSGDQVTIDLDANEFGSGLDSALRLFDSSGNQVAVSDNNPAPGESFSTDSYIDFTASSAQTYYVGVSSYYDFYYDPFTGSPTGYGYTSGTYTLNVSVGSGNFSNQVTLSEPNDTISQAFDTGLSSANPGTFIGSGFINTGNTNPVSVNNSVVTANLGTLNSGESATVNLTLGTFSSGYLLSKTNVTSSEYDYNLSNNFLVSTKTVNSITPPNADLELTQIVSNSNPRIGDQVTLTLTLTNKGPGTATVIKVQDILPGALSFVSASADLGSYDSNTGIWTVGNMPPNEDVSLKITANVSSGQSITNTAEVIAVDEGDPDSTPNNNNPNEDDFTSVILDVVNEAEITGTSGRDELTGTSSNDRIIGLQGADKLTSGGGNDQFVYTNIRDRGDTITDFEVGKDNIVLTQLLDSLVTGGYNGTNAIADGYVKVVQGTSANNFSVQIDTDGLATGDIFRPFITVKLTNPDTLNSPSNFVF
ncbi:DUF11 domain-containing protein [Nostocaceae cyanobacterium CENA369]|uniref:DUF11 domain-containing protein n=1 Tax=Dendronalium phyllosphericum CENA369 TaxID=1725256 RepID=A0A8J7LFY4_9NOST|nr:pre-peptidase C-terminal domain-containing protein [Dendronalium phyllosphericum]MBH8572454.1 DUF11 domain-containing protein [Dendronalium phyllosphericum CENA369]